MFAVSVSRKEQSGRGNSNNRRTMTRAALESQEYPALTQAWLDAIDQATDCLRHHHPAGHLKTDPSAATGTNDDGQDENPLSTTMDAALDYLATLEATLASQPKKHWQQAPTFPPPSPPSPPSPPPPLTTTNYHNKETNVHGYNYPVKTKTTTNLVPSQVRQSHVERARKPKPVSSSNPFASIAMSDDEDEDEDDNLAGTIQAQTDYTLEEDAGDVPVLHPTPGMTLLRLVIRIHTSTSDIWAYKGNAMANARQWVSGAAALQAAIQTIRQALDLADAQISKYYQHAAAAAVASLVANPTASTIADDAGSNAHHLRQQDAKRLQRQKELEEDADIVHVAVQSLVRARDRYLQSAKRQVQRLERVLQPQWESRDQVKESMGQERWTNNPNPKRDYAALREASEAELRQLQDALQSMEGGGSDGSSMEGLSAAARYLKLRLLPENRHRYNGQRPEQTMGSTVVRLVDYPDPTSFGWTFTGSHAESRVEFFEKIIEPAALVKLDVYYTTGTLKTSMDHPAQGKTQLFCASEQMTPELYVEILKNPRVHTDNQRYQRTANRPSNNQTINDSERGWGSVGRGADGGGAFGRGGGREGGRGRGRGRLN